MVDRGPPDDPALLGAGLCTLPHGHAGGCTFGVVLCTAGRCAKRATALEVEEIARAGAPVALAIVDRVPLWDGAVPLAVVAALADDERERLGVNLAAVVTPGIAAMPLAAQLAAAHDAGVAEEWIDASPLANGTPLVCADMIAALSRRFALTRPHARALVALATIAVGIARVHGHRRPDRPDAVAILEVAYRAGVTLRDNPAPRPDAFAATLPTEWLSLGLLGAIPAEPPPIPEGSAD